MRVKGETIHNDSSICALVPVALLRLRVAVLYSVCAVVVINLIASRMHTHRHHSRVHTKP